MIDVTPNVPEVVAEVRARFERYEQALLDKDVDVLDATGPGLKERRIRLEILTLGRDLATVNLEFKVRGKDLIGRQSQTWVRFPELGWKVVSAHVSTMNAAPLW
jgi:Protein of unknown function (DUF3225)